MDEQNKKKSEWTTIAITKYDPDQERPKGGTLTRLESRRKYKRQSWDEIVTELLDMADKYEPLPGNIPAQ